MKKVLIATMIFSGMFLVGCSTVAKDFTAMTTATANKDGFYYQSTKNQEALKASGEIDPATGKMSFDVSTTATTPEAAIAAALSVQAAQTALISKLMDQVSALASQLSAVAKQAAPVPVK